MTDMVIGCSRSRHPVSKSGPKTLMNLPSEVKELVNAGVYSLFRTKTADKSVAFVLVMGPGSVFLLSETGEVVGSQKTLDDLDVKDVIIFPEASMNSGIKVNCL